MAGQHQVVGDGMVGRQSDVKQGDLSGGENRAEVRAPIVAEKPGQPGGAKGCRKVDA